MGTFEVEQHTFSIMLWLQACGSQGVECGGLNEDSPTASGI